ncbi:NAD(P)H-hydrate dehydratase [Snuella lapsa]|uniref:Bifunctional NAD(P)H-hydrate repair enzyme n=1 Tax=Snuella lapsa TaxID=870481 RepID=A0ABP6XVM7_9FLAO
MKLFSKEQIYEADRLTIERQNISSADLMERAGTQLFNWMHARMQGAQVPVHVFCGIGNNGGDGLVLARHLTTHGYHVKTYIVNYSDKRSKDFLINYDRIKSVTKDWPVLLTDDESFPEINPKDIIVDAVFGIGLNRPVVAWVVALFDHFRASKAFTLSVDVPSGLYLDKAPEHTNNVVSASFTLSFAAPKLAFFLPQTAQHTVQWDVLDIGFDQEYLSSVDTEAELIAKHEVLFLFKPRTKFSHKGQFGHSLIIGGSYGKIGAVTLACKGALSAGSGLVTAYIPKCGYTALQASLPEAMVITDTDKNCISNINVAMQPSVVGLGVGMGTDSKTLKAFEAFLKENKSPLVLDADGLNMLAQHTALLKMLPAQTVLTPHPKELERLIGVWKDDFDKLEKVKAFAHTYNVIVVIKGAHTITISNNKLYVNTTGNPGLATAGSGDVLTGIITGLISQGYAPLEATVFGVYLHGKAADIAVGKYGYQSLLASHVIDYLGAAYLDLFKKPDSQDREQEKEGS